MKYDHVSLILVLNCGSSSIKFSIINPLTAAAVAKGLAENIETAECRISWENHNENKQLKKTPQAGYADTLRFILNDLCQELGLRDTIRGIGHRVVHGGERFTHSVRLDAEVITQIEACNKLAPLHNPKNLLGIRIAQELLPELEQVAVFDTAFHQQMPKHAYLYAIPHELYQTHGIRRYGFHGTSHRYVSTKAAKILGISLNTFHAISIHLGNGCSIAAIKHGHSIDTSMGFTPLEGLVMGTRSGDIDPSIPFYLIEHGGYTAEQVNDLLNKKSGLLGLSNISNDMRDLEKQAAAGNQNAALAIKIFCYRIAKYIGAYSVALGKIDALIFTGGIGENSALIRNQVVEWLSVFNYTIDVSANNQHGKNTQGIINRDSHSKIIVVKTDEEALIAQDTHTIIQRSTL